MIATVPKIGSGVSSADMVRPDTTALDWQVIEERETEFVIEILDEG